MKKLNLLLTLILCTLINTAFSQVAQTSAGPYKIGPPDQNSMVQDSSGMVYPYIIWHKLMQSGDYAIKYHTNGTEPVTYLIAKRTSQEKSAMMAMMPKPKDSDTFKVGDVFKPFKDKDISGQKIDIKELAGKVVVLNFWFIGCPPCRAEIPDLNKLAESYKDNKNVVFVAIALDEDYEVKDFIKANPLGYHLLYAGRYIAAKYAVKLYPTNVVIGRDGKVAYSSQGGWPGNPYWIQKTIDQSLNTAAVTKMAAQ